MIRKHQRQIQMKNRPIASLNQVSMTYHNASGDITPISNVSLDIYSGDFIALCGVSGSGKSTLLNILAGIIAPTCGTVIYNGRIDLAKMKDRKRTAFRRRNIGMVFQDMNLIGNMTARENIVFPLLLNKVRTCPTLDEKVNQLISILGLDRVADSYPFEMSGGEQQRTAIARAILPGTLEGAPRTMLLADEPTGNLDAASSENIGLILQQLNSSLGQCIILATHDNSLAKMAKTRLELQNGTLCFSK